MCKNLIKTPLLILATSMICAEPIEDCGLEKFLKQFAEKIYRAAEVSGEKNIPQILADGEDMFAQILSTCSPSAASVEPVLQAVAAVGTPKMLAALKRSAHYDGCDNVAKNNKTPLAYAAEYGNVAMVKALHAEGADVHRTYQPEGFEKPVPLETIAFLVPFRFMNGEKSVAVLVGLTIAAVRYPGEIPFSAYEECGRYIVEAKAQTQ